MKKSKFWTLGLVAACFCGLTACSESVSSEDSIINGKATSSSSNDGKSTDSKSSSSKKAIKCDTVSTTLAAPTNLQVVKNGDNKWVLFWNYTTNDDRPETKFIVEVLDMADSLPKWATLDSTNAAVVMYNLVGETKAGKYYRVSAGDECGLSKTTDMIQVSSTGATTTSSAELAVPSSLKLDTLGENMWQLSWSYTNNTNRPENGFKLQSLDLNAESPQWKDDGKTNKGVHVIKIDGTKKGGLLFHVAAVDTNGISSYSEEISIPRVPDSTDLATNTDMALAVPTDLKIDSIDVNKYQLSWSYTNNSARPEDGFKIQALDITATSPSWAVTDSTNKGVRYIIIDATKRGGNYVRVAARDSKGLSVYSTEVQVPKAITPAAVAAATVELAEPTSIKIDSLGENKYRVSWSYTNNKSRPEAGFVAQVLDMKATTPAWVDYPTKIKTGVHYLDLNAQEYGEMYVHVAAEDSKGRSTYSSEVQIPKYSVSTSAAEIDNIVMAVPSNLKIDSINVKTKRLSWSYTNVAKRPEDGFVIQYLDLSLPTKQWSDIDSTSKGVRYWDIDAQNFSKLYLRVAAKDTNHNRSEFSTDIMVPEYVNPVTVNTKIDLAKPSNIKLDSVNDTTWRLTWSYTRAKGRDEDGFIVQNLSLDDDDPDWTLYKTTKAGVKTVDINSRIYSGNQFRVAAYDASDITDYTTEVQMPVYSKPVYKLAVPTNINIDSLAPNKWRISWSYSDNDERTATGFKLQKINATSTGNWSEFASTNSKDVQFYIMSVAKGTDAQYVRVAADDGKTPAGGFSSKILVPKYTEYIAPKDSLNVPTGLSLDSLNDTTWTLSWSYTDVASRSENGFVIKKLAVANTIADWEDVGSTNKGVRAYNVNIKKHGGSYVKVAAKDADGIIGEYSQQVKIPVYNTSLPALAVPSGLKLDSIGDNKWRLSWNYTDVAKNPASGFIIQETNADGASGWDDVGTTDNDVKFIIVQASTSNAKYLRVAAVDADNVPGGYSANILLAKGVDLTAPKAKLNVPTNLKLDSIGENLYQISWSYTEVNNRASDGFVLQYLKPANGSTWSNTGITPTKKDVKVYVVDATTYGGYYFRVAAKDENDEIGDYSSEIKVPQMIDYTTDFGFNIPMNLKLDSLGDNKYRLSWSYTDASGRPANGFVLQKLQIKNGATWEDDDAVIGTGVLFYELTESYCDHYIRVAAKDDNGKGEFSAQIRVPTKVTASTKPSTPLAVPAGLKIEEHGTDKYLLSWSYANNTEHPENGFKLQYLKLGTDAVWENGPSVKKGIHYAEIDATIYGGQYVRVAAIGTYGEDDISEYSDDIKIPEASGDLDQCSGTLAAPTALTATRVAPSVWQLSWSYERSATCAEKNFIVEKLDVQDPASGWTTEPAIDAGVHYTILDGYDKIGNRYRVKAVNGTNESEYSEVKEINTLIPYNAEYEFEAPTLQAAIGIDKDGKYEMHLVVVDKFPNHAMESFYANYTTSIQYEFRWFIDGVETSLGTAATTADSLALAQTLMSTATSGDNAKKFDTGTDRYNICNAYAQVRTIWKDKNGQVEMTEWSTPAGTLPGYEVSDPLQICECRDFKSNCVTP